MPLRLPQEVVVETFLPALRAMLARRLTRRGMTQQAIADRLGVSQPAISKYVQGRVDVDDRIADDPQVRRVADEIADGWTDGDLDDVDALTKILDLVRSLEDRGPLCTIHEEQMPSLDGLGCDLCVAGPSSTMLAERDVLSDVRRAVRRLAAIDGLADHVPNVGTNVGACLPGAADVADVAAVPGRIYVAGETIHVPAGPAFGASRHVAATVLIAHDVDETVRGAVNLATSEAILDAADQLGLSRLEFDADYDGRRSRLRSMFQEHGVPDLAYHAGAFGIEPVAYVFGTSATDAVETIGELVGRASQRSG